MPVAYLESSPISTALPFPPSCGAAVNLLCLQCDVAFHGLFYLLVCAGEEKGSRFQQAVYWMQCAPPEAKNGLTELLLLLQKDEIFYRIPPGTEEKTYFQIIVLQLLPLSAQRGFLNLVRLPEVSKFINHEVRNIFAVKCKEFVVDPVCVHALEAVIASSALAKALMQRDTPKKRLFGINVYPVPVFSNEDSQIIDKALKKRQSVEPSEDLSGRESDVLDMMVEDIPAEAAIGEGATEVREQIMTMEVDEENEVNSTVVRQDIAKIGDMLKELVKCLCNMDLTDMLSFCSDIVEAVPSSNESFANLPLEGMRLFSRATPEETRDILKDCVNMMPEIKQLDVLPVLALLYLHACTTGGFGNTLELLNMTLLKTLKDLKKSPSRTFLDSLNTFASRNMKAVVEGVFLPFVGDLHIIEMQAFHADIICKVLKQTGGSSASSSIESLLGGICDHCIRYGSFADESKGSFQWNSNILTVVGATLALKGLELGEGVRYKILKCLYLHRLHLCKNLKYSNIVLSYVKLHKENMSDSCKVLLREIANCNETFVKKAILQNITK
eukprot:Nk52_evm23s221 gene=Nk52_evmTU23s221